MKKLIYLLAAVLAVASCLEDRTLTDYKDIILPELNNPNNNPDSLVENHEYLRANGQLLELTPDIVYKGDDELAYKWVIDGKDVSEENLSDDPKNLKWIVNLEHDANCALYVTRVKAGNDVIFGFNIKLDHPFERGWVVATEKNGYVTYDFLQEIFGWKMKYVEHSNVLITETPVADWGDCLEFWAPETWNVNPKPKGHMTHFSTDPFQTFSVDELSMVRTYSLQEEFFQNQFPEEIKKFKSLAYGGYVSYLLGDNGKIYERKGGLGKYTGKYMNFPVQYEGKEIIASDILVAPYKFEFLLTYDNKTGQFYTISNGYQYDDQAGTVSEIPTVEGYPNDLNEFKGEDIVYYRVMLPPSGVQTFNLFMVTKNQETGAYSASEYAIATKRGKIKYSDRVFLRKEIPGFGENSEIVAKESPQSYQPTVIYYTDNADPRKLMCAKRTKDGIEDVKEYHTFESEIVSMDQGCITSSAGNIGVALKNGSVYILNVAHSYNKAQISDVFVPEDPDDPEAVHSVQYFWKGIEGNILKIDFRYGQLEKYFFLY